MDGGQPEGFVQRPDDLQCKATTVLLVKGIGDAPEKRFPGWLWAIQPNERGGVLNIRALRLSGEWGYMLLLSELQNDPTYMKAVRAAGEILERFRVPRGCYSYAQWAAAPKDIAGMAHADVTDKATKVQRTQRDLALTNAVQNGSVRITYEDSAGGTHRRILVTGGLNGG